MRILVLVNLALMEGITTFQKAMQYAATITDHSEMEILRHEARKYRLKDNDKLLDIKERLSWPLK